MRKNHRQDHPRRKHRLTRGERAEVARLVASVNPLGDESPQGTILPSGYTLPKGFHLWKVDLPQGS